MSAGVVGRDGFDHWSRSVRGRIRASAVGRVRRPGSRPPGRLSQSAMRVRPARGPAADEGVRPTPASPSVSGGRRHTATRWKQIIRSRQVETYHSANRVECPGLRLIMEPVVRSGNLIQVDDGSEYTAENAVLCHLPPAGGGDGAGWGIRTRHTSSQPFPNRCSLHDIARSRVPSAVPRAMSESRPT